jgi:5-oxoprolinase (ATP-hydrolysing)
VSRDRPAAPSGPPDASEPAPWFFWIDRGGTFTDAIGIAPDGALHVAKLLSSETAPVEAIRGILARHAGWREGAPLPPLSVRLGTTIATNALLERRGVPTLLATNPGLGDLVEIGTQERPDLFALAIVKPLPLAARVVELAGRSAPDGSELEPQDEDAARAAFAAARAAGLGAAAIVRIHAYADPAPEARLAELAREAGFEYVAASAEVARELGLLARAETTLADAYLTPLLRAHADALAAALPGARLRFMQSSGGLTDAARFRGPVALLSGPAGGAIGAARVAREHGARDAIGFDMGGTSTDVALLRDGEPERSAESVVAGVRVRAPALRVHTIAAGGGSLCRFDGVRLTVGPESAGARPGPLCYGLRGADGGGRSVGGSTGADGGRSVGGSTGRDGANGGRSVGGEGAPGDRSAGYPLAREIALTDANLLLGRLPPDRFPFPLVREPVERAFEALRAELARAGHAYTAAALAAGFVEIANERMAQAIAEVSVQRGVDPRGAVLVGFGGAAGQHAAAVARRLGIRRVIFPRLAGVLSAYGIGVSELAWDGAADAGREELVGGRAPASAALRLAALEREGRAALAAEGAAPAAIRTERSLDLRYRGTDTALAVDEPEGGDFGAELARLHRERYGYDRAGRAIEVVAARVRARAPERIPELAEALPAAAPRAPAPRREAPLWVAGEGVRSVPLHWREDLAPGVAIEGPALVLDETGTIVIEPGFRAEIAASGALVLDGSSGALVLDGSSGALVLDCSAPAAAERDARAADDPVRLEVAGSRFMAIAEQMGAVLRHTAVSTNIKDRLDYSCAVFDAEGALVANAPHIPVHLGAMGETVRALRAAFPTAAPGDAWVTNDPFRGGSHLPDVTVVTPVFAGGGSAPDFYVASRGHHADLGGPTPGSMPADSRRLADEGILLAPQLLVSAGRFAEAALRAQLEGGPFPARSPDDNLADLEAMAAANRAGAALLARLAEEQGLGEVAASMAAQKRAAAALVARQIARLPDGERTFADALDDGTPIRARLTIDGARLAIDFAGSGAAVPGNLNAPPAVVHAAVLYVLRALVDERIPLNAGCLAPVTLRVPAGSILDPPPGSAVVGGNVETSQRVVDVLLGAFGAAAASQGTMNNVAFGNARFGYYETIGGGAGAGPGFAGASGVHVHMTNTRITDAEVLETRFPVRLVAFARRRGSGGAGRYRGGDGLVRAYRFLEPVTVSLLAERRTTAPFGLEGGGAGLPGRQHVVRRGPSGEAVREPVPGHATLALAPGDELWIETPGGGGYGEC